MRSLIAIFFCALVPMLLQGQPKQPVPSNRKALVMGIGAPISPHAEGGKRHFLKSIGNANNDPAKGWTCEFTWDLMRRMGLDPQKTSEADFFKHLQKHEPGYRIAINCGPFGASAEYWEAALDCGIMPFAPPGNNNLERYPDGLGLQAAIGVAGGTSHNLNSFGPAVEFIDALARGVGSWLYEEAVQSYANQRTAARFAILLDRHPEYNIWDARQHLRQSASNWATGWNETNGYGRPNENAKMGPLEPGPPVAFKAVKSRDNHRVTFTWRNFLQTDFQATVIARKDGRVIYDGKGQRFDWTSDVAGDETFVYWSRNRTGKTSRIESYQRRPVTGLENGPYHSCVVFGYPTGQESKAAALANIFSQTAPGWVCDQIYRRGHAYFDALTDFPLGAIAAVLPDYPAMMDFALTNHYRIIVAPLLAADGDPFAHHHEWKRANAAGVLVVMPHHYAISPSRKPQARRTSPPRLSSAITVGYGVTNNIRSFGPGLEFFDSTPLPGTEPGLPNQADAAAVIAGKLARILDQNPSYNNFDARQHLRMCSSLYKTGWVEDGGFGRPPETLPKIDQLDPAPPLDITAEFEPGSDLIRLQWQNFRQSSFLETVIKADETEVYSGAGTNFTYKTPEARPKSLRFFTRDKSGTLSKPETYTTISLVPN